MRDPINRSQLDRSPGGRYGGQAFIFDAGEACSAYIYTRGVADLAPWAAAGRCIVSTAAAGWLQTAGQQGVGVRWWGELTPAATALDGEIKLVA